MPPATSPRSCCTATRSRLSPSNSRAGRGRSTDHLFLRPAHLFDPYLAAQSANLDPLPHQIDAVYGEMLARQPLRYLLADDPDAGKTIMAGLLIKELMPAL